MRRFYVNCINDKIKNAAIDAERLLHPESVMVKELLEKNDWKYDSGSGLDVYNKIASCNKIAPVFTYKPKWIFTKALGYSDGKAVFVNLRKLDSFSHQDIIGLLCHEWLHVCGFSHGNDFPSKDKNLYSVNYFVSQNVGKWL